jgi:hypothetical protein
MINGLQRLGNAGCGCGSTSTLNAADRVCVCGEGGEGVGGVGGSREAQTVRG